MISGLYSAASGMIAQTKKQETISGNLIGASCPGFKKSTAIATPFSEVLSDTDDVRHHGVLHAGTYTSHTAGRMRPTDEPLDFAIEGDGFFAVQSPGGTLYTRNGSFMLGQNGKLVTSSGYPVLGERGEINIPQGEIKVDDDGNISAGGANVGQIKVVTFDKTNELVPVGAGLFRAEPTNRPSRPEDSDVRQGLLEMSNVSLFEEMSDMVFALRCYETCQKTITLQDESLGKAISEIGNVA